MPPKRPNKRRKLLMMLKQPKKQLLKQMQSRNRTRSLRLKLRSLSLPAQYSKIHLIKSLMLTHQALKPLSMVRSVR